MSNAVDTLVNRLDTVVDLYRVGGSITNAEIIGVLEIWFSLHLIYLTNCLSSTRSYYMSMP